VHVPYKGGPPAVTDMMGGRLDFMFYSSPSCAQQIEAGRLRALGSRASGAIFAAQCAHGRRIRPCAATK